MRVARPHAVIEIGTRKMNEKTVPFIRDNGVGLAIVERVVRPPSPQFRHLPFRR